MDTTQLIVVLALTTLLGFLAFSIVGAWRASKQAKDDTGAPSTLAADVPDSR